MDRLRRSSSRHPGVASRRSSARFRLAIIVAVSLAPINAWSVTSIPSLAPKVLARVPVQARRFLEEVRFRWHDPGDRHAGAVLQHRGTGRVDLGRPQCPTRAFRSRPRHRISRPSKAPVAYDTADWSGLTVAPLPIATDCVTPAPPTRTAPKLSVVGLIEGVAAKYSANPGRRKCANHAAMLGAECYFVTRDQSIAQRDPTGRWLDLARYEISDDGLLPLVKHHPIKRFMGAARHSDHLGLRSDGPRNPTRHRAMKRCRRPAPIRLR
jgi:hypothetical protein